MPAIRIRPAHLGGILLAVLLVMLLAVAWLAPAPARAAQHLVIGGRMDITLSPGWLAGAGSESGVDLQHTGSSTGAWRIPISGSGPMDVDNLITPRTGFPLVGALVVRGGEREFPISGLRLRHFPAIGVEPPGLFLAGCIRRAGERVCVPYFRIHLEHARRTLVGNRIEFHDAPVTLSPVGRRALLRRLCPLAGPCSIALPSVPRAGTASLRLVTGDVVVHRGTASLDLEPITLTAMRSRFGGPGATFVSRGSATGEEPAFSFPVVAGGLVPIALQAGSFVIGMTGGIDLMDAGTAAPASRPALSLDDFQLRRRATASGPPQLWISGVHAGVLDMGTATRAYDARTGRLDITDIRVTATSTFAQRSGVAAGASFGTLELHMVASTGRG